MKRCIPAALTLLAFSVLCSGQEAVPAPQSGRPKVALVLEGGAALGLAHIGALKVIEEMGIPVDIVVGTSMGSIVGGLYGIGYDSAQLEKIMEGTDWIELFSEDQGSEKHNALNAAQSARYFAGVDFDKAGLKTKGGLLEGRNILNFLDRLTLGVPGSVDFDALPRRYRAVATDLESGGIVALDRGNLADAMRASMSIPAIFTPYFLDGKCLVDGGVVDNLPVDVAKAMGADVIIAVDLIGGNAFDPKMTGRKPFDSVTRSLDQLIRSNTMSRLSLADFVITVDLENYWLTDFDKGAQIVKLGEEAARAREGELRAFMEKRGALGTKLSPTPLVPPPTITALAVEGALSREDRKEAVDTYSGAVGLADSGPFLESAYRALNATGKYEYIRLRLDASGGERTLVVSLRKKSEPSDSLRLGISYNGYFADSVFSRFVIAPSVALLGITGEGSQLNLEVEMLDTPGVAVDFIQPIAGPFDLRTSLSVQREYNSYYDASAANYQYQTSSLSYGLALETGLWANELLSLGWSGDWLKGDDISSIYRSPSTSHASLISLGSDFRKVDHPILPTSGLALAIDYRVSLEELGSGLSFQTLSAKAGLFFPLSEHFSLGIRGAAGTDFSRGSDLAGSAPLYYKPALSDRSMFPAPLTIEETMGSLVAGGGFDLKFKLEKASGIFTIPFYFIATTAAGAAFQDSRSTAAADGRYHANATIGVGVRLDDAFGVYLRGGGNLNSSGSFKPFLAVDMGAIPL